MGKFFKKGQKFKGKNEVKIQKIQKMKEKTKCGINYKKEKYSKEKNKEEKEPIQKIKKFSL